MGRGAAAGDKNGCERTRKRDHDSQTHPRPRRRVGFIPEVASPGFSALCQSRMTEGGIVPPHSVLAPGSALRSVPTVALSSAQVKGNCIMAAAFGTGHGPQARAFQTHRRLPRRRCAPKDSTQADNNDQGDLDTDSSFREGVSLVRCDEMTFRPEFGRAHRAAIARSLGQTSP